MQHDVLKHQHHQGFYASTLRLCFVAEKFIMSGTDGHGRCPGYCILIFFHIFFLHSFRVIFFFWKECCSFICYTYFFRAAIVNFKTSAFRCGLVAVAVVNIIIVNMQHLFIIIIYRQHFLCMCVGFRKKKRRVFVVVLCYVILKMFFFVDQTKIFISILTIYFRIVNL